MTRATSGTCRPVCGRLFRQHSSFYNASGVSRPSAEISAEDNIGVWSAPVTVTVLRLAQASLFRQEGSEIGTPRDNRVGVWFRGARAARGNCPPAARPRPCRTNAPSTSGHLAPRPRTRRWSAGAPRRPTSSRLERLAQSQIDAALAGQRMISLGERGDPMVDEAIGTAPYDDIAALQRDAAGP